MDQECIDGCSICFDQYDDNVRPRSMPCGHSYCTSCLNNFIEDGALICPYCKQVHSASNASEFPINYSVELIISNLRKANLIESLQSQPKSADCQPYQVSRASSKWQALISEQRNNLESLIQTTNGMEPDLNQYAEFLRERKAEHEELFTKINDLTTKNEDIIIQITAEEKKVTEFVKEKDECKRKATDKLKEHKTVTNTQDAVTASEEIENCHLVLEDWKNKCQEQLPNAVTIQKSNKLKNIIESVVSNVCDLESHNTSSGDDSFTESSMNLMEKLSRISGDIKTLKTGDRVVKGKDWNWGNQDGPSPSIGTVIEGNTQYGWIRVKWDHGIENEYRIGAQGCFDLKLA